MPRLSPALSAMTVAGFLLPALSFSQTYNQVVGFGAVAVGASTAATTLTFTGSAGAAGTVFIPTYGSEFTIGASSCSGGTCSVPVTFQPAYPGIRKGAVGAYQNGALIAVTPIVCLGQGPLLNVGPGQITTIGSRTSAPLNTATPFGIAARSSTQIYLADSANHRILLVNRASGQITVVAGTGTAGFAGDGGPATQAQLYQPSGLAIDPAGNLLIADTNNYRIRKIDVTTGNIFTVAGTGAVGSGGDGGPAGAATFNSPSAVAVDTVGDIYISDTLNARVRVISAANGNVYPVAGNGAAGFGGDGGLATSAQLNGPIGLAVDQNGNLYIADVLNSVIREVAASNGTINASTALISTVAGISGSSAYTGDGGAATSASLNFPYGVEVDAGGNLYIADDRNNVIREVTGDSTHIIRTIAGTNSPGYIGDSGSALSAKINSPTYLSRDNAGNLYFVDSGNFAVRAISSNPSAITFPTTAVGATGAQSLLLSNSGNQTLNVNVASSQFPANFTAGGGGTCTTTPSLASGQACTLGLSFVPSTGGSTSGTLTVASNSLNSSSAQQPVALTESNGLYFVPVTPCRVVDTRLPNSGAFGAPSMTANTTRDFAIRNSILCPSSIPAGANVQAYSLNVTAVPKTPTLAFVTVYPANSSQRPSVSNLNAYDGRTKANAAIIPADLSNSSNAVTVYVHDDADVILDLNGYFVPENSAGALAYFPVPPCRVADTRESFRASGLGTPSMAAGETRSYPLQSGNCALPSNAQAYAVNFTAIPKAPIPYLITWATGAPQPVVSTLNATTGAVTANAAIVPAGTNGAVSVYTTAATDFIIDVSGYYAAPSAGGLALYNLSPPCRAYDTRLATPGGTPITGTVNVNVQAGCNTPVAAQDFVANVTVLPVASLSYLIAWAQGTGQPVQSTLNAYDGAVTSNLAIIPTTNGSISTYSAAQTGLLVDVFGYFAP